MLFLVSVLCIVLCYREQEQLAGDVCIMARKRVYYEKRSYSGIVVNWKQERNADDLEKDKA